MNAGLYIHVPFCRSKCAYCDFYSTANLHWADSYSDMLLKELALRAKEVSVPFTTIYLGGGTPSILSDESLERLFKGLGDVIDMNAVMECTIEANPEDITETKIDFYRGIGINRISIGIQSFDDRELGSVSRRHAAVSSFTALKALSASGINYNADLIYGLPGQSLDAWKLNLSRLLEFRPPHFSAYLLSYEAGTKLYAHMMAGKVVECDDMLANAMYDAVCVAARDAGYEHYEVSNYALPGLRAKHNSSYWDYSPYLGLGPASHSFDGVIRRINPNDVKKYIASIQNNDTFFFEEEETLINRFNDYIITSLRTKDGFNMRFASEIFGHSFVEKFLANVGSLANGMLVESAGRYFIPESHWLTSDAIMRDLILD